MTTAKKLLRHSVTPEEFVAWYFGDAGPAAAEKVGPLFDYIDPAEDLLWWVGYESPVGKPPQDGPGMMVGDEITRYYDDLKRLHAERRQIDPAYSEKLGPRRRLIGKWASEAPGRNDKDGGRSH